MGGSEGRQPAQLGPKLAAPSSPNVTSRPSGVRSTSVLNEPSCPWRTWIGASASFRFQILTVRSNPEVTSLPAGANLRWVSCCPWVAQHSWFRCWTGQIPDPDRAVLQKGRRQQSSVRRDGMMVDEPPRLEPPRRVGTGGSEVPDFDQAPQMLDGKSSARPARHPFGSLFVLNGASGRLQDATRPRFASSCSPTGSKASRSGRVPGHGFRVPSIARR